MATRTTHLKIILSGSTIEVFNYQEAGLLYGYMIPPSKSHKERIVVIDEATRLRKMNSRKVSMERSNNQLRRSININAWAWKKPSGLPYLPVFVTFTFAENVIDIPIANRIFSNFIKRLNYFITEKKSNFLKYIVVTEFQDKRAKKYNEEATVHYHVVFFNLKHIWKDTLAEIWEQGNVDIKKIEHVDNVGAYVSKYMSKHFEDDRLDGKKRYFSSRGLLKPTIIKNEQRASVILKGIPIKYVINEKEFKGYHGQTKYRQYKLPKGQTLVDIIPDLNTFYDN